MIRVRCSVVPSDRPGVVDVEVTGPVGCTLNDVRRSLLVCAGLPDDASLGVGSRVLDGEAKWGIPPLLHGCLLVATGSDERAGSSGLSEEAGVLVADVVGGPDSGRRYPLRPGDHVVGRAGSALRTDDPTDLLLAGVRADTVPAHQPPGRAVRASDGAHAQIALPGEGW